MHKCEVILHTRGVTLILQHEERKKEMYSYKTRGTCSREIQFDIAENKIKEVRFIGGCMGNTLGISALVKGRDIDEVIGLLKGIDCGGRGTSCPDQLAIALTAYKQQA